MIAAIFKTLSGFSPSVFGSLLALVALAFAAGEFRGRSIGSHNKQIEWDLAAASAREKAESVARSKRIAELWRIDGFQAEKEIAEEETERVRTIIQTKIATTEESVLFGDDALSDCLLHFGRVQRARATGEPMPRGSAGERECEGFLASAQRIQD